MIGRTLWFGGGFTVCALLSALIDWARRRARKEVLVRARAKAEAIADTLKEDEWTTQKAAEERGANVSAGRICEYCGPDCQHGAAHNERVENGDKARQPVQTEEPK